MSCPICSRETDPKYRPFCSRRCADVDLAKWLGGSYAIPSDDPEDMEKAAQAVVDEERKPH
ncbi:DNA gyrase inhibitor YacG [Maliponia aquimaris]|uniref:DNA gyrase inhibitor YacG n=1 Tax=Maliponia aquimaris TaxID=1673631 RepID=A0A238KIG1_9RHOB|nr:DNA gyrase inhibitor YacG [Maliponia aquimaris]SMX42458.1 zinc-binding protein [Maliponia aquimaris]